MTPLAAHLTHLRARELTPVYIRNRERAVQRLEGHLDARGLGLHDVTADDLADYLARIPRRTARSRYSEQCHLRGYYQWCAVFGHADTDPTLRLPKPRLPRLLPRPISEGDLSMAIDALPAGHRIRAWLVLAAYQGFRACEISALDRDDVLDSRGVIVAHGKGRKDRVVPLGERALMELRAYGLGRRGPMFPRTDGKPGRITANRVCFLANQHLHGLGIDDTLHQLRHRAATRWYAASQDLLVTANLLGHSDIATTTGYAQYSDLRATAAVRALDLPENTPV